MNRDLVAHKLHILQGCGGTPSKYYKLVADTVYWGYVRAKMLMFRYALRDADVKAIIYSHPMLEEREKKKEKKEKKEECDMAEQERLEKWGETIGKGAEGAVFPVFYESMMPSDEKIVLKKSKIGPECYPSEKYGRKMSRSCISKILRDREDETSIDVLGY